MSSVLRLLVLLGGAALLASCATTDPFAARYDSCDREAGACYADCRALEGDERRAACQDRCTTSVNRCFAQVRREAERQASYRVAPDVVFYGRYGAYDPYGGYRYGRHGRRYSFNGYRYDRFGYDRWGYDRYGFDRYGYDYHGRRRRVGPVFGPGAIQPRRPSDPTVTRNEPRDGVPDDGRYTGPDGSVYTEDGRRLRYGGEPQQRERPRTNGVRPTGRTGDPTVKPARPDTPRVTPKASPKRPKAAPKARPRAAPRARPRSAPRARSGRPKRIEP